MTGDENDYVAEYRKRHPAFPFETTLDQLFSEEQFEAYRALAFHAVKSVLMGEADVAIDPGLAESLSSTKPAAPVPSGAGVIARLKRKKTAGEAIKPAPDRENIPRIPLDLFRAVFSL
ncbi:hypothetical protein [Oryzibacter oryziterrae]|uniref:hypothetical protein n=1 Tax=Oryzibacter oryziterrae TaxID=2766474 RepID=UPI001F197727|nr:hypothetical protein [Oryzibacter oryziterrae]